MLLEEGMERVENRHRLMSKATLRVVEVLGLKPFAEKPSISVSSVFFSPGRGHKKAPFEIWGKNCRRAG